MSRNDLREIMKSAWRAFRVTGKTFSECLKQAWCLVKLKAAMIAKRAVEFYYQKINGEIRQAFGTLKEGFIGEVKGSGRKPNADLFTYYDVEKGDWRSFKKFNLIRMA